MVFLKKGHNLYSEFKIRYQAEGLELGQKEFQNIALKAKKEAKNGFQKIEEPKITSKDVYIYYWIRDLFNIDLAKKSIKGFTSENPPKNLRKLFFLSELLPPELVDELYKKIYNANVKDRKKIWTNLRVPLEELEKRFIDVIKERNEESRRKGYKTTLDFYLKSNKISKIKYEYFLKNLNRVIKLCNKELSNNNNLSDWFYTEFNNFPCFVCQMNEFPFESLDSVFLELAKKYKILTKYKNKIVILQSDIAISQISYIKERDIIQIIINNNQNIGHQCLDLIHELSHAIFYIKNFQEGTVPAERGKYRNELDASKLEMNFLKNYYNELYKANLSRVLSNLIIILFEISIYENPNQNLGELFARCYNKCFYQARQKNNPLFILEKRLIYQPFKSLPHAIADVNII